MINIVRVYDKQVPGTHREYVGRSGKGVVSVLGNPAYQGTRDENCEEFVKYFELMMCEMNTSAKAIAIRKRINELVEIAKTQDIELACFCQSPKDTVKKRCHTMTIKAYIEQQLEESKMKTQVNEPIGIIRPVVNQMDCIPSFRNELAFLSNMHSCEVVSKNWGIFQNAEAAYQAMKCVDADDIAQFNHMCGYTAKRVGKTVKVKSDWNEVKLSIMENILRAKFQGELLQKLLAVKGEIVERNNWGDSYWGVCNGKGENHLGKILMKIRDENAVEQTILEAKKEIAEGKFHKGSVKEHCGRVLFTITPSMTYAGIG